MPIARSTKETFDFVVTNDRALPKAQQTTFHLRRLPTVIMLRLRDLREGEDAAIGSWMTVALRAGIAGWTNFLDADGAQVPFALDAAPATVCGIGLPVSASEAAVNRLGVEDATEIALAIMRGNELTTDDVKN